MSIINPKSSVAFALALTISVISSVTHAFTYNGLNYNILSSSSKTVTVGSNTSKSGAIVIPGQVSYYGEIYTVTEISTEAFKDAIITSVSLPETLISISGDAFLNTSLTELVIPNSVTTIGNGSFANCRSLKKLTLGSCVRTIGADIFTGLSSLTEVVSLNPTPPTVNTWGTTSTKATLYVPASAISAYSSTGIWKNFSTIKAYNPAGGEENPGITLPGDAMFANLQELSIGNQLDTIYSATFKDCVNLTTLNMGTNVTTIEEEAFSGCIGLTTLVLSPELETIEASAFEGCTGISSIVMGSKVKSIGDKAFHGTKADNIYITAPTPPQAPNTTFSNYSGRLHLQDREAMDAYYDAYTCWDRFDSYEMTVPTDMRVSSQAITGGIGECIQLNVTLYPEDVTLPQIFFYSTNPEVATVDNEGLVTIVGSNTAESRRAAPASCKIIATTLYADGPVAEVNVQGTITGIDIVYPGAPSVPSEIDYSAPYEVFTLGGHRLKADIEDLEPGIYIVRQGAATKKIVIE